MPTNAPQEPMSKSYTPSDHEARIWQKWMDSGAFHADPSRVITGDAQPYTILIPPPNVTAALHLGHALNNSIQDILIRAHRMKGFETLWMPGTDHAGIATQTMVDRKLKEAGEPGIADYKKMELEGEQDADGKGGREQFLKLVHDFKDQYETRITDQLMKMGCSCDWDRQRFTMDDICARAVREAFFQLFKDGLIYRGKRLVNWDPVTQTALADDEVEMEDIEGFFWYMKYPIVDDTDQETGEFVTVATTRPETFLGDTGIAVNPKDPNHAQHIGKRVKLPFVGRIIPIIGDDYVVMADPNSSDTKAQFASGYLKVTPAHDPNDWLIGQRHDLEVINIMAPDASISDAHGWEDIGDATQFVGLSREDARIAIETAFRDANLLEAKKPYTHSVGHSYRSHAAIEPYLSDQWYCKVSDDKLRGNAQRALKLEQRTEQSLANWPESTPVQTQSSTSKERLKQWSFELIFAEDDDQEEATQRYMSLINMMIAAYGLPEQIQPHVESGKDKTLILIKGLALETHKALDEMFDVVTEARAEWSKLPAAKAIADSWTWINEHTYEQGCSSGYMDQASSFVSGDSSMSFFPARYAKTYETWHDNLRDWCISRQLWWGHRIPVWSRQHMTPEQIEELKLVLEVGFDPFSDQPAEPAIHREEHEDGTQSIFVCFQSDSNPDIKLFESSGFTQDPDVLDTWFSSALWPLSTMGWPDASAAKDASGIEDFEAMLSAFNPTAVLTTAREIITLWVSRMTMFNRYFLGENEHAGKAPFKEVFIHAMIQDGEGRKMSKSLGNGLDPLDIIDSHGADAMRFTLCQMTTQTQDVRMPVELDQTTGKNTSPKFDLGRNLCNKLWNAAKFAMMMLEKTPVQSGLPIDPQELTLIDRWMLSRVVDATNKINTAQRSYLFKDYADAIYDLFWRDFCDWYLESIKPTIEGNASQAAVLRLVFESILRLMHPVMPFITETLSERFADIPMREITGFNFTPTKSTDTLCQSGWPEPDDELRDEVAEDAYERVRSLVSTIREIRAQSSVTPKRKIVLHATGTLADDVARWSPLIETLAGVESVSGDTPEGQAASFTFEGSEYQLSNLADALDEGAERERLEKELAAINKSIGGINGRLSNPGYTDKAPAHLVQQTRDQLAGLEKDRDATQSALDKLG